MNSEGSALFQLTLHSNLSLVPIQNIFGGREPQPHAVYFAGEKGIEQFSDFITRYSLAIIGNGYGENFVDGGSFNFENALSGYHRLHGIDNNI